MMVQAALAALQHGNTNNSASFQKHDHKHQQILQLSARAQLRTVSTNRNCKQIVWRSLFRSRNISRHIETLDGKVHMSGNLVSPNSFVLEPTSFHYNRLSYRYNIDTSVSLLFIVSLSSDYHHHCSKKANINNYQLHIKLNINYILNKVCSESTNSANAAVVSPSGE